MQKDTTSPAPHSADPVSHRVPGRLPRPSAGLLILAPLALSLGACQAIDSALYGEPPRQPQVAAISPPPPPPTPPKPPEARGVWVVGTPSLRARFDEIASSIPDEDMRPKLRSSATAAAFRAACAGAGLEFPDAVAADRPINASELKRCSDRGIQLMSYQLTLDRWTYVKASHLNTVPGLRDVVDRFGVQGSPARATAPAATPAPKKPSPA